MKAVASWCGGGCQQPHRADRALVAAFHQRLDQAALVVELPAHRAAGHVGGPGDQFEGGGAEAVLDDAAFGRIEDVIVQALLAFAGAVQPDYVGHGVSSGGSGAT